MKIESFNMPGWCGNRINNPDYISDNHMIFYKNALPPDLLNILSSPLIDDNGVDLPLAPRTNRNVERLIIDCQNQCHITREWSLIKDVVCVRIEPWFSTKESNPIWVDHTKLSLLCLAVQYDSIICGDHLDPVAFYKGNRMVAAIMGVCIIKNSLIESINGDSNAQQN